MYTAVSWQIWCIFFLHQLNFGLTLPNSSHGTDFTHWSEDDWLETRFFINTKFIFNRQRYEHLILRTRMNEWSLELLYGNRTNLNKLWTELHLFLDRRHDNASLNNSLNGHVLNQCRPPIISPLTNDSNTWVPELVEMDKRIANYFVNDGFFRTINYIHCTIDEQRRNPSISILIDIYLVTNREFQSLLYIEMPNITRNALLDRRARFYLHNYEEKFNYNFALSSIDDLLTNNTSLVYMMKLYNQIANRPSSSLIISLNGFLLLFNFCLCWIFASFI